MNMHQRHWYMCWLTYQELAQLAHTCAVVHVLNVPLHAFKQMHIGRRLTVLHCLWLPEQKWHLTIGFEVNCRKVGNSCLLLPYDAGGSCPQFIRAGLYWNELPLGDKAVCTCSHSSLDYTVAFSISLLWLLYLQWRLYHELYPHPVYSASQH